ncbi:MAG: hypothetical protein L6Q72_14905, partial [Burkholderiaceae bacterium]|nr:hypothetical protein [Burkholderiaceae bacterium]
TRGDVRLALPQLEATISWASVPTLGLRFASLSILAPELDVRRMPGGHCKSAIDRPRNRTTTARA